jgi:hypothetical protein
MPEIKGKVTDLIKMQDGRVFGLKFGTDEYLYSFENNRSSPFDDDTVQVGSLVRIEWAPFTDKKGKEKKYVNVLELMAPDTPVPPPSSVDTGYRTPDQMQRAKALTEAVLLVNGGTFKVENVEKAVGAVLYAYNEFLGALNDASVEINIQLPGPEEVPFE